MRQLLTEAKRHNSFKGDSLLFEKSDISELVMLVDLMENFLNGIQSSTISLEQLRSDFALFFVSFKSLEGKIDKLCNDSKNLQSPSTSYTLAKVPSNESSDSLSEFTKVYNF